MNQTLSKGWRFAGNAGLSFRCWEQECVLFDPTTGDTHLLGREDADLLQRFREAPLTLHTFPALQAAFSGIDLETVLADFERREFITRV